jgi:hypothetical protein
MKYLFTVLVTAIITVMTMLWYNHRTGILENHPLNNKQILNESIKCNKRGFQIQMVYDSAYDVYAVKCIKTR